MLSQTQNLRFSFFFSSLQACRKRQSGVGATSARVGETKKKEDTRRTPEFSKSYPFRCPTLVQHRHDAKNGVSMQPSLVLLVLEGLGFGWYATTEAPWRISLSGGRRCCCLKRRERSVTYQKKKRRRSLYLPQSSSPEEH